METACIECKVFVCGRMRLGSAFTCFQIFHNYNGDVQRAQEYYEKFVLPNLTAPAKSATRGESMTTGRSAPQPTPVRSATGTPATTSPEFEVPPQPLRRTVTSRRRTSRTRSSADEAEDAAESPPRQVRRRRL